MRTVTPFQRLALVTLAVCLVTFVATRFVSADHPHPVEHRAPHDTPVEAALAAEEALLEADAAAVAAEAGAAVALHEAVRIQAAVGASRVPGDVLYERTFAVRSGDRLTIQLSSEDVVVEPSRGREATVTVEGRGRDARDEFERRRFTADYTNGTLRLQTNPERRRSRTNVRAGFTVTVRVPAALDVSIALSSGDVRIGDMEGALSVEASSGDVHLGLVERGPVTLNTSSGDITARGLAGPVAIHTSSGDVELGEVYGENATIHTSSGDVTIRALEAARFSVSSSSGDIEVAHLDAATSVETSSGEVQLTLVRLHALSAQTGSGDVELGLPTGTGAAVTIHSGDIDIDEGLQFHGARQRRMAEGRLGAGGPSLSISTGSGSVGLYRR